MNCDERHIDSGHGKYSRTHIMLIFRFIILFRVTTRIDIHALMLEKHISCIILSSAAALYSPLCLKQCVFAPGLFKARLQNIQSALIGQPTHSTENNNRAAELNQFLRSYAKLATCHMKMYNVVTWCHKVQEFKVGLLTRHFRSNVFCGQEELLLVRTLTYLIFKNTCTRTYINTKGKEKKERPQ